MLYRVCHGNIRLEAGFEKSLEESVFMKKNSSFEKSVFMCMDVYKCHLCIRKQSSVGLHKFEIKVHFSVYD